MAPAGPIDVNLWPSADHSRDYLKRADSIPHRREGEAVLLEFLPDPLGRFLDVGCGAGRLLTLVRSARPSAHCLALDFSPTMLSALRQEFGADPKTRIVEHDFPINSPNWAPLTPWSPALQFITFPMTGNGPFTGRSSTY